MNSSRIELLWLVWDQSRSKYHLRTKFQDVIDKPQKCQNVCYHPSHQQQSDFLILVLYDFIVQSILFSFLLLCYNLMIMNDYEKIINTVFILHSSYETLLIRQKCKQYILKWDAVGSILKQTKRKHQLTIKTCTKYVDKKSPVMRPNLQPKIYKSPVVA